MCIIIIFCSGSNMANYGSIEKGLPRIERKPRSKTAVALVGGVLLLAACVGTVMYTWRSSRTTTLEELDHGTHTHGPLPFGWKVRYTAKGQKFYLDQLTGMTQYARPKTSTQLGYKYSLSQAWKHDPRLRVPSDRTILTNANIRHYGVGGIGSTNYPFQTWTPPPPQPYLISPAVPSLQAPVAPAGA